VDSELKTALNLADFGKLTAVIARRARSPLWVVRASPPTAGRCPGAAMPST
jgi:hypothetical protein